MKLFVRIAAMLVLATVGPIAYPAAAAAAMGPCNAANETSKFTGFEFTHGDIWASDATFELYDERLCTFVAGWQGVSVSSTWTALAGSPLDANLSKYEIYQVGVVDCVFVGQPITCPSGNQYFWAYGHPAGTGCGDLVGPSPHFIKSAPVSGTAQFTMGRVSGPPSLARYTASINGYEFNSKSLSQLDDCWQLGPRKADFYNETKDPNDQVGGGVGNPNWVTNVRYRSNVAWYDMTEQTGDPCLMVRAPDVRCTVSYSVNNAFKIYDARIP